MGKCWPTDDPRRAKLIARNKSPEGRARSVRVHRGKKYSQEIRNKISSPKKGWVPSENTILAFQKRSQRHMEKDLPDCQCYGHQSRNHQQCKSPTKIETLLSDLLSEFPKVQTQIVFGRYTVDAYLPFPYHLAFEADGEYWHRRKQDFDIRRDEYLMKEFSLPVVRLSEMELYEMRAA